MRHDAHYVEEIAGRRPTPIGRLIALEKLDPNPEQPRVEIGDLTDLTASIKEKGVLEPLLVKVAPLAGRFCCALDQVPRVGGGLAEPPHAEQAVEGAE